MGANVASILPAAGTAIGSIWGPAGAAIGGAAGSVGAAIFADNPQLKHSMGPGRSILAAQMRTVEKLQEQTGMSPQQVQRMSQANMTQRQEDLQRINALQQRGLRSPLEREGIVTALKTESMRRQVAMLDRLQALDERQEARNLANVTSATQVAAGQAQAISEAELRVQKMQMAMDQAAVQNFSKAMSSISKQLPAAMASSGGDATKAGAATPDQPAPGTEVVEGGVSPLGAAGGMAGVGAAVSALAEQQGIAPRGIMPKAHQRGINVLKLQQGGTLEESVDFSKAMGVDDFFFS